VYFDARDHGEAIEFGRPGDNTGDAVTYNELDVSPRPRPTSSRSYGAAPPSTKKRTDTRSPHPTCFWRSGDQPRPKRQTTRTAASSKASCLPGPATTTRQQTSTDDRVQSTWRLLRTPPGSAL